MLLIVIAMDGIYSGMFTPIEAAAMSADYAFIVAVFVYKDWGLKDVPRVLLNSANMSEMPLYIITNAVLFFLFPVAMILGIDPVHFGIVIVVNMEVGMCHPPVGLNLYVASGIAKRGITELTVAVWLWLLSMHDLLVVVTYWPGLSV